MTGKVSWNFTGQFFQACNCAWGCPCNFNAPPTTGFCDGVVAWHIEKGKYGMTKLDGLTVAGAAHWPKQIHEGNGTLAIYIDERATPEQRQAILAIFSGQAGGGPFPVIASTISKLLEPRFVPVEFQSRGKDSRLVVKGLMEAQLDAMHNPVTKKEVRGKVVLPDGFIFQEADVYNATKCMVKDRDLDFSYSGTNGHIAQVSYRGP
ncbi:MAG: DUF1326 domain-containing protein [Euryarchaeota archaeon]|nr:DUF1326 domain-containing protein [Euryarchaeota archaeon]